MGSWIWCTESGKVLLFLTFLVVLLKGTPKSTASTHWVVTGDGRIQSEANSIFHMKRSYDLMALMQQEDRVSYLQNLKYEISEKRLDAVEKRHDVAMEGRILGEDEDCVAAKMSLAEYDLFLSTLILPEEDRTILRDEFSSLTSYDEPNCYKPKMSFKLDKLDDLTGVAKKKSLAMPGELGLAVSVLQVDRFHLKQYGHLVAEALMHAKRERLWVAYMYASNYWRIVGKPWQAIECQRRAFHLSPAGQRHVPLLSMGNVLHRSHHSEDAVRVLETAATFAPNNPTVHLTLGNVHATLLNFNQSADSFQKAVDVQPDFETARLRRHAVLCHQKIERALENQQRELRETLDELRQYKKHHELWAQILNRLVEEQADVDVRIKSRIEYENSKTQWRDTYFEDNCHKLEESGTTYLTCNLDRKNDVHANILKEATDSHSNMYAGVRSDIDELVKKLETRVEAIAMSTTTSSGCDLKGDRDASLGSPKIHSFLGGDDEKVGKMSVSRTMSNLSCETGFAAAWDTASSAWQSVRSKDQDHVVAFEADDGQRRVKLPRCGRVPTTMFLPDHLEGVKSRETLKISPEVRSPRTFQTPLTDNVFASVGSAASTIASSLEDRPENWVVSSAASLYWRIEGDALEAIECARHSIFFAPPEARDSGLMALANVLIGAQLYNDALVVANSAYEISGEKVALIPFQLGNIYTLLDDYRKAIWFYEKAADVEPTFTEARNRARFLRSNLQNCFAN